MRGSGGAVGLTVRQAAIEDDHALADLFNRSHQEVPGPVVRTAADIGWRCRRQPGMSPEGAFLAETPDGGLLGYALVKDNGDVLEFVVDRGPYASDAAAALVAACERRARDTGADRIRVNVPTGAIAVAGALDAAGWAPAEPEARHYISAIDPARLVHALAANPTRPLGDFVIEVLTTDALPWQEARSRVSIGDSTGRQERFTLECDQGTLNHVLLGGGSAWLALARRRLRIRPIRRAPEAVRIIDSIAVTEPWSYHLGDVL